MVTTVLVIIGVAIIGIALLSETEGDANSGSVPDPPNAAVGAIANAIATAEGYFTGAGSIPFDQNNPGDLTDGADTYGANDSGITIFPTVEAGWQALYAKIQNILDGNSDVYDADSPLSVIGNLWSGGDPNWASNVASSLGVSTDSSLSDVAGSS
jgi:hypothetical protein